jgi:rare lipoprotein A
MKRALPLALLALAACATVSPPKQTDVLQGVASWYGEEFAGRTTANGEIFDPLQFTAAHRTLPFGTVVDVFNPKTEQAVRVRINDRGPYVGTRVIDLSYAAAQKIGLIDPGSGIVEIKVVTVGRGDREPPAPYVVEVEQPPKVTFPLPAEAAAATPPSEDFHIEVLEERKGVVTRRQVSADGKRIEEVPVEATPAAAPKPGFVVQVGAFTIEANAKSLQAQLSRIGQQSYIEKDQLFHVRIGPFATRELAVKTRAALEAHGLSAIVTSVPLR